MKKFKAYIEEQLLKSPKGILHKNPKLARDARGKLRNELKNPIKASGSVELLSKYTDHEPLLKDLKHAAENYPESDVRPIVKTHIRRLKIPHMGI